jgi:hypothetical protein
LGVANQTCAAALGCNSQPPECVPASASQQCGAQNVNIRGEVLTPDVNSMNYSGEWQKRDRA